MEILRPRRVITSTLLLSLISCVAFAGTDIQFHKIRAGETLALIAKSHGVSYRYLACLNRIADPDLILIGQRIELPSSHHNGLCINLSWPVNRGWVSSSFGPRRGNHHNGVDIAAPRGTPVRAADTGKVVFSGVQNGYGKVVILQHSKNYRTVYAHLSTNDVKINQKVQRGQRIARVGSSGHTTGPHLHFEVRENGKARNPMSFLPRETQVVLKPETLSGARRGGK